MANVITVRVTAATRSAQAGFARIQAAARRMAADIERHARRAAAATSSRFSAMASTARRAMSTVGSFAAMAGARLLSMAASAREGAQAFGLAISKYVALAGVVVHALPSMIDLLGIVQLLPAAILAGGLAMATFKLATAGIGDAISEALDDFKKWRSSSAAKGMTYWTRDFVIGIVNIRNAFKGLRRDLSDRIFKGLGIDLVVLTNTHMPSFAKWSRKVATSMNDAAHETLTWLSEAAQASRVEGIFRNVAGAIDSLLGALKPLARIFLTIAEVAAPRLASIASTFQDLITKAADWIDKMKESGKLGEWLDKAIDGFTELRGIVADLVGVIAAVYGAADTGGQTFLASLHEQTSALKEWAESAAGERAFKGLSDIGKAVLIVGVAVAQSFIGVIYIVQAIGKAFNGLVKIVLNVLSQILHSAAAAFAWVPGLGPKLDKAAKDFDAYRDRVNKALNGIEDETVNITFIERKAQGGTLGGSGGFRGLATGGIATGIVKVGERGTELIDLGARGGRVRNAGDTRAMTGSGSGAGSVTSTATVAASMTSGGYGNNTGPAAAALDTLMRYILPKLVDSRGGRVRVA